MTSVNVFLLFKKITQLNLEQHILKFQKTNLHPEKKERRKKIVFFIFFILCYHYSESF